MKNLLLSFIIISIFSTQFVYSQWTDMLLPAAPGGDINSIVIKGDKIFAGKREGIFVSDDDGLHWRKINPKLPARYFDPQLFSIIATDDYIVVALANDDVHISWDNGVTWISQGLTTHPHTTPFIMAADGDWIICGQVIEGYFNGQSTDAGQSWTQYDSIPSPIYSAAIHDSVAFVATPSGLFRSVDFGTNWDKVHDISTIVEDPLPIAITEDKVYIGVSEYDGNAYILASPDNGASWPQNSFLPCQFLNAIIDCPASADSQFIFAASDSGIFRSDDKGQSWIKKNSGLKSDLVFSLAFKEQNIGGTPLLLAGTSNGIFVSSDYGNSWTGIGGPEDWVFSTTGTDIYGLSSQPILSGYSKYSYSNARTGNITGIIHSANNGTFWDKEYADYLDGNSQITSFVVNNNNILFAAGYRFDPIVPGGESSIVFSSENGGSEWKSIYIDSSKYAPVLGVQLSDVYMNIHSGGLYRFFENGNSRELLHPVLSPLATLDSITYPPVSSFATDGNTIYLSGSERKIIPGTRPPKVYFYNLIAYSDDNGQNWTRVESPLDSITMVNNMQTDTLSIISEIYPDGNHIMVGMYAYNFSSNPWETAYGGGFFHLFYNGSKWIIADTAFTNISVFAFAANGSTIFAGTEKGVFSTNDHGSNWYNISTGMGNIYVKDLFISGSYLFASTSNGVWKRPLAEITSIDRKETNKNFPGKYSLSQNYPNPFNPLTIIYYQLATTTNVKLIVYDSVGREVKTLVNQRQTAGTHKVAFNAQDLSSGVYIYKLKAGKYEQSRKMILLR